MDKMTPTINEFANYYEFRGDYDHTPTDGERTMIEDAITGYLEDTGLAQALTTLQGERDRLREALEFYRDEWRANADGDIGEAHLTRTWMEPTDALFDDAGHKARTALHPEPSTEKEGEHG